MAGEGGLVFYAFVLFVLIHACVQASADCTKTFYDGGNITLSSNESSCTFFLETSSNHSNPGMVLTFHTVPSDVLSLKISDKNNITLGDYSGNGTVPVGVSAFDLNGKPGMKVDLQRSLTAQGAAVNIASFTTKTLKSLYGPTEMTSAEGSVYSPGWPANYPPNVSLNYHIKTKYDQGKLILKFKTFSLANGSLLLLGSSGGITEYHAGLLKLPADYHASSNTVAMLFTSSNNTGHGFHIEYNEVCPYNNEDISCEEAENRGQRKTILVVVGSIGTVLALIAVVAFFYWYIKKNYHHFGYQDITDPKYGVN